MAEAFLLSCKLPQSCKLQKATHLIFDLDGTLIDTQNHYLEALKQTCSFFGKKYDSNLNSKVIGRPTKTVVQIILENLKLSITPAEFEQKYRELAYQKVVDSEVLPGVDKLIRHFHKHKIPMAIATSSVQEGFEKKMMKHKDLLNMFGHYVVSSDPEVKNGKPFPDIFLVTASRFPSKPSPTECLVFEDSLTGVAGAKAARMQVVMIPDPTLSKSQCTDATLVIDSLEHFKPELFGLPAMN